MACSPSAQTYWRRDFRGNGIAPAKQQITTCDQSQHCHGCIEHQKKSTFPNLIVHDCISLIERLSKDKRILYIHTLLHLIDDAKV